MAGYMDLGRMVATLGLNTSPFMAGMNASQSKLKQLSMAAMVAGRAMTRFVTLPMALAGGAAISTQKNFEASMTKIVGLVGVARKQVETWNKEVLKMAMITGRGPEELADALYFVTSAGIRGAEAMEVLEMSAKASAAGLGETKVVADLVTSAMNAYGKENLSAAQATDILVASVREGKAEADELAGAMGMVLPIASEFGVTFDQVGAAFAGMTRTGTNARVAATQLKAILSAMASPSMQSADAMAMYGTNAETFRKTIREKGLITALLDLKDATKGHDDAMAGIFPNIRALMGVLDLLGANMQYNVQIFEALSNAGGSLERAFAEIGGTTQQKLNVALATFKATLIGVGEVLKPFVVKVLASLNDRLKMVSSAFQTMTEGQKKAKLRTIALTAAFGPFLLVVSKTVQMFTILRKVIVLSLGPYGMLLTVMVAIGAALARHISKQETLNKVNERSKKVIDDLNMSVATENMRINLLFSRLQAAKKGTDEWNAAKEKINSTYGKYLENLITEKDTTEELEVALTKLTEARLTDMKVKGVTTEMDRLLEENANAYAKSMQKFLYALDEGEDELLKRGKLPSEFTKAMDEAMNEGVVVWEKGAVGWEDTLRGIGEKLYAEWVYGVTRHSKSVSYKNDWMQNFFDQTMAKMNLNKNLKILQDQLDGLTMISDGITIEVKLKKIDEDIQYTKDAEKSEGRRVTLITLIQLQKAKIALLDGEAKKVQEVILKGYDEELRKIDKIRASLGAEAAIEAKIDQLKIDRKKLSASELEANSKKIRQTETELKTLQLETSGLSEIEKRRGRIELLREEGLTLDGKKLEDHKLYVQSLQRELDMDVLRLSGAGKLTILQAELVNLEAEAARHSGLQRREYEKLIRAKNAEIQEERNFVGMQGERVLINNRLKKLQEEELGLTGRALDLNLTMQELTRQDLARLAAREGGLSRIEEINLDIAELEWAMSNVDDERRAALELRIQQLLNERGIIEDINRVRTDTAEPPGTTAWFQFYKDRIAYIKATADEEKGLSQQNQDEINALTEMMDQKRLEQVSQVLQAAQQMAGGMTAVLDAQMNAELKKYEGNQKKREEIELKYLRKKKRWALIQAILNTAVGVTKALEQEGPLGIITGIAIAAVGGIQAGIIAGKNFAEGGVVYGETMARVAEYPGARQNPEVIAPLDKLKNFFGDRSAFEGTVVFEIEGRKLVGILQKETVLRNSY